MEANRKVFSNGDAIPRTRTSHAEGGRSDKWREAVERLGQSARHVWEHTPLWIKRPLLFLLRPIPMLIIGLLLIGAFAVLFNYYLALSKEIDTRLRASHFIDGSVGIFTSPIRIRQGDRFTVEELSSYLLAAGYVQRSGAGARHAGGTYSIEGKAISIWPGSDSLEPGLTPVKIVLSEGEGIESLHDLRSGAGIDSALIEGELLASVRGSDRRKKIIVSFSDIPDHLRDAVLAIEDRRFFSHNGVDWRGIMRALWIDLSEGEIVQGGSTITQQVVKNAFLNTDRTLKRKIKEAGMAIILESRLSKEEIFAHYCNDVYLGQSGPFAIHGFAEAARTYFDKTLADLTLAESAFLAGLVHAPNRYNLDTDRSLAVERRNQVLDAMVETRASTRQQAEAAKAEPLEVKKQKAGDEYGVSYFIDYAQRFINERGYSSRQRYYITMDPRLQRAAYRAVERHTKRLDRISGRARRKGGEPKPVQAALVAIDAHTGEVLAMIGGRSYDESPLNRATDARRQPGSAFKPFVYAAALSGRRATPATMLSDRPQEFTYSQGRKTYAPSNFHDGFSNRDVTLRDALTYSMNVPAVELAMRVGLDQIARLAEDCGFPDPHAYPSLALGTSEVTPLQLAGAYTAFANQGHALRPVPVRTAAFKSSTNDEAAVKAMSVRAFSSQVAYIMTDMMQSVVERGTAARLRGMGLSGAVAGKTGTSNDGWFAGYTPNVVCVAWVGIDDNTDIRLQAAESALPLWADFMREALDIRPDLGGKSFPRPTGITTLVIDPLTGMLAGPHCYDRREEVFISGTEPVGTCSHESMGSYAYMQQESMDMTEEWPAESYTQITLEVCSESGLLATSECHNVERMSFEIGREPVAICRAHRPRSESNEDRRRGPRLSPPDTREASEIEINSRRRPRRENYEQ